MKKIFCENEFWYKVYLNKCLMQNIEDKIENPPLDYQSFEKLLNKRKGSDIIKEN